MSPIKSSEKTISAFYGQKERAGDVGLEIEVEAKEGYLLPNDPGGVWLVKSEGSLRNGLEYYTRQPLKMDDSFADHVKALTSKIDSTKVDMSIRTSVHVHINVQRMTPLEAWTAAVCYWLLEGPLTRFCGQSRVGNLFCLGLEHAEGILHLCLKDLKNKKAPFSTFVSDLTKYGSQNLSAIQRFGSIEYRSMRGTLDADLITTWCETLYSIVQNSRLFKNPADVLDYYVSSKKDEFLNALLPGGRSSIIKEQKDYTKLIENNVLALADFAYYPRSWDEWAKNTEKSFEEVKKGTPRRAPRGDLSDPISIFEAMGAVPSTRTWRID